MPLGASKRSLAAGLRSALAATPRSSCPVLAFSIARSTASGNPVRTQYAFAPHQHHELVKTGAARPSALMQLGRLGGSLIGKKAGGITRGSAPSGAKGPLDLISSGDSIDIWLVNRLASLRVRPCPWAPFNTLTHQVTNLPNIWTHARPAPPSPQSIAREGLCGTRLPSPFVTLQISVRKT
ncbi:hypothetical protein BC834DRAFT_642252 [Gloeopeniophorella convolvens]|nr:hypothetical protein BC834DRAFT_642252 [Gloeopeniophorella convolvens]